MVTFACFLFVCLCVVPPLLLLLQLLLLGLRLHLLHLDGVGLASAHVQLVVAHGQLQDARVHTETRAVEYEVLQPTHTHTHTHHKTALCKCVCLVTGWPHLAQLESGVGGATASPGPVRVWGGWGYSLTWPS